MKYAGKNRIELEKAITYYSNNPDDKLKLKAAQYLIANMPGHYTLGGEKLKKFDQLFDLFEQKKAKEELSSISVTQDIWDSLEVRHGVLNPTTLYIKSDIENISANIIIENIEFAFKAWEMPWARHISFEDFCEYILPYRVNDEQLESFRPLIWEKYKWLKDSLQRSANPVEACKIINEDIEEWYKAAERAINKYPITMKASDIMKVKTGSCMNQGAIATYIMRSLGIPVVLEYVPQWGSRSNNHYFSAVLDKNGKFIDFLGGEHAPGENEILEQPPKIFRKTYSMNENELLRGIDNIDDIPKLLQDPFFIDVTKERVSVADVEIELDVKPPSKTKYAYLCVFNNHEWVPVFWGKIKRGKAMFKDMGRNIVYLPVYHLKNRLYPAANPFILRSNGEVAPIEPDETQLEGIKMNRKYPLSERKREWMASQIGGTFQGANIPDFSDAVDLYTNKDTVDLISNKIAIQTEREFRYVRYLFAPDSYGSISEIAFYTKEDERDRLLKGDKIKSLKVSEKHLNMAFDRKIAQYIGINKDGYNGEWIGLDLKKPKKISRISFCPRTDTNNIYEGMQYEVLYWKNGWNSLGTKVAEKNELVYHNVPSKALLWLRNLSQGKEERIFTYENGNQVWW
jgi:hypothetical protein